MSEGWLNQVNIDRALSLTPEPASRPFEKLVFEKMQVNETDWEIILNNNFSVTDPKFSEDPVLLKSGDHLYLGEWFINPEDQFYQLVQSGEDAALVRAHVRPRQIIAHDSKENFVVNIHDGRAFINGDSINQDVWLTDENVQTNISKRGKELVINGNEVKGNHHAIVIGNEAVHLVDTGQGWELVNEAVFEAKYPKMKEKAEKNSWNQPIANVAQGIFKELGALGNVFKPRDWRDAFALLTRGISEIGGPVGASARAVLLFSNFVSIAIREGLTFNQLKARIEADVASSGLTKKEKSALTRKAYVQQTILGKLLSHDYDQTDLYKIEQVTAISVGVIAALSGMGAGKILASAAPGSSITEILLNRGMFSYIFPRLITYVGKTMYELAPPAFGLGKYKTTKEAAAKEFVELALGTVSATVTTLVTAGFMFDVGGELISKLSHPVVAAEATPTSSPTVTATETVAAVTGTALPTQTESPTLVPTIPPTEVVPPTPEFSWLPGMSVDKPLLQHAADQNYGWGIDLDHNGQSDFQAFWLDQNSGPDVIIDADNNHFIQAANGHFFLDRDHNGFIDANEARGFWDLKDLHPNLEQLQTVSQAEAQSLPGKIDGGVIDINFDDISKAGGGHLASPALNRELDPLPPKIDLVAGDNHEADLVKDGQGYFADNNHDNVYTEKFDTRISELKFDQVNWQIDKAVYADGSMWLRSDDGELVGVMSNGRRITLDDSSGTSRLQLQMHQENPAWSPFQVGRMAVVNPNNLPIPAAPATPITPPQPIPEQVIETEHGSWHQPRDGGQEWGIKSSGDRLILGPAGGVQGVLAQQLHLNNQFLTPDDAAVIAHRVALENKDAFAGQIGDGSRVTNAMVNDPTVVQNVGFNVDIVAVERFLENHGDWLKNKHFDLSDKERYEVAKLAAPHWSEWDDEDEIKTGLLGLIPQVEAAYD